MSIKKTKSKNFYITTPIYYANAKPHIGHAYTTVAADVLARWNKLNGKETFLLTGTDEHGLKIQKVAEKAGKEPQQFVDEISSEFKTLWKKLNIDYNNFIRTTDAPHKKAVQAALQVLKDKGAIYQGTYEGLYCIGCEQFKTENELVDGKCPDHNAVPEKLKEECYLLRMSGKTQEQLEEKIKNEFQITPDKYKVEILSFFKNQKIKDISISRKNVSWGIPLPFDPSHTTYVWVDAFLNYLTGLGWKGDPKKLPKQWPPEMQLIGKDILRVHATIWPIILMHLGISLPKKLFTHGHILAGGKKMSKTLGNVIAVDEMIGKFGVDATRYLLMSAGTFGEDVDLTMERAAEKYAADLQNGLGNLVARVLTMVENYFDGKIPDVDLKKTGEINKFKEHAFEANKNDFKVVWDSLSKGFNNLKIDKALGLIISFGEGAGGMVRKQNRYIDFSEPWKLIKTDKEQAALVIYDLLESLRQIAWLIRSFMPETSDKIFCQLFADEKERAAELSKTLSEAQKWGGLKPGTKIKKGENLFPRLK
ncbi:MAG: methionine--tRNA ligase [bacterium]|nr:methionine--tRNA ligase [bacterium]